MFQYNSLEEDLSRCSSESEEDGNGEIPVEELFEKPKKGKKERRGHWKEEHIADDLIDIILNNDKYKEKLILTNANNVKNGQYYDKVIKELKEKCSERGEEVSLNVAQAE